MGFISLITYLLLACMLFIICYSLAEFILFKPQYRIVPITPTHFKVEEYDSCLDRYTLPKTRSWPKAFHTNMKDAEEFVEELIKEREEMKQREKDIKLKKLEFAKKYPIKYL